MTAMGIGYTTSQQTPTLIRRRMAQETRFVTVYDLGGAGVHVLAVSAAGPAVSVRTAAGVWQVRLLADGADVRKEPGP